MIGSYPKYPKDPKDFYEGFAMLILQQRNAQRVKAYPSHVKRDREVTFPFRNHALSPPDQHLH